MNAKKVVEWRENERRRAIGKICQTSFALTFVYFQNLYSHTCQKRWHTYSGLSIITTAKHLRYMNLMCVKRARKFVIEVCLKYV